MSLKVTPILGVVTVSEGGIVAEDTRSAANNTKWLFDVEGEVEGDLVIQLVDMRGNRPSHPDLAACTFLARSVEFYDVKPFEAERVRGLIRISHGSKGPVRYRVMVDTMHTAMR